MQSVHVPSPSQGHLPVPDPDAIAHAELVSLLDRFTGVDGVRDTRVPGLSLGRLTSAPVPSCTIQEPSFCVIAQGAKELLLGDETHRYDANHYLVVSQDLPVHGRILEASPGKPHLAIRLGFSTDEITDLAASIHLAEPASSKTCQRGMFTGMLNQPLREALVRMLRLLDHPNDIDALAPLIRREILYRVMQQPEGWRLLQMAQGDGNARRIARVIQHIRANFAEPLRIEDLSQLVHMSESSLHHHFKAVTSMSPLQYLKQIRLQRAHLIMLHEQKDAGVAAHRVGYESQSQFSREYGRFFGLPPAKHIRQLREMPNTLHAIPPAGAPLPGL